MEGPHGSFENATTMITNKQTPELLVCANYGEFTLTGTLLGYKNDEYYTKNAHECARVLVVHLAERPTARFARTGLNSTSAAF